jgi:hypothetical protein
MAQSRNRLRTGAFALQILDDPRIQLLGQLHSRENDGNILIGLFLADGGRNEFHQLIDGKLLLSKTRECAKAPQQQNPQAGGSGEGKAHKVIVAFREEKVSRVCRPNMTQMICHLTQTQNSYIVAEVFHCLGRQ